jgi:isoleucyl-tRNA synthetase
LNIKSNTVCESGFFTEDAGLEFQGLNIFKEGNEKIIKVIENLGRLVLREDYTHKYPYDWRSKTPVIIRTTMQWFANLKDIKNIAIKELSNTEMYPKGLIF